MRLLHAVPLLAIVASSSAYARHTVVVGSCLPNSISLPTITQAIAAAGANTLIKICPGTYPEQLTITKSVTLEGVTSGNSSEVLIVPPAGGLTNNAPSLDSGQPTGRADRRGGRDRFDQQRHRRRHRQRHRHLRLPVGTSSASCIRTPAAR
ncbi:MAG: hypothetical protein WDN04_00455 [Rhodospirillales bacterium]